MVLKTEIEFNEPAEEGTVLVNNIEEMHVSDSDEEHNAPLELQNTRNSSLAYNGVES